MVDKLSKKEIEQFIVSGFIRIDNAFSLQVAEEALNILWKDIPFERSNPNSWTEPVIRLGMYTQDPFIDSVNTPKLHTAYNQLVGTDKWIPCRSGASFSLTSEYKTNSNKALPFDLALIRQSK